MKSDFPECDILIRPRLTEKAIAEVLRSNPSPVFCRLLADMLDPPAGTKPRYGLRLKKPRGRPKKDDSVRFAKVGDYMARRLDVEGAKYEDVVSEVEEKFGVHREYANNALQTGRLYRQLR